MKRLVVVLAGLLVLPAFAEVVPPYYDAQMEYADAEEIVIDNVSEGVSGDEEAVPAPVVMPKGNVRNTTRSASRAMPTVAVTTTSPVRKTTTRAVASSRGATTTNASRTASSRAVATRAATTTAVRGATAASGATRANISRSAARGVTTGTVRAATARDSVRDGVSSVARSATRTSTITQNDTVNTPLYSGRVGVRTSSVSAAQRIPAIRTTGTITATSSAETETTTSTVDEIDELAQLTDFCKAQYTQCMDNYCNVLDDNQGRCSCSANLSNYADTENALKKATEELQDVAQKIQYIGLTADQITTLFSQTEAEIEMQSTSDTSQIKNDLDRIKKMIVNVNSGKATASTNTGLSFDLSGLLDFSIDSTGFDLSALFGQSSNTSSISNQRGSTLYNTAAARCKSAVLDNCKSQGVDISLITNGYDLEIDKQCILYERSLTESNEQMSRTVRNAKSVLQKARLMVAQEKNAYDLRGCINALDSCMQDDFVCGSDYENCLDPTGKYIINSAVVVGSTPGVPGGEISASATEPTELYATWNYTGGNAWGNGSLRDYITENLATNTSDIGVGVDKIAKFLQSKIGYIDSDGKAIGMCSGILNQCQDYTFDNKKYVTNNEVIRGYLERTLIQIKAKQDEVLSDYAESCVADVSACLTQNAYQYNWSGVSASENNNPSEIAIRACMSLINTCKSVTTRAADTTTVYEWLNTALNTTLTVSGGTAANQTTGMITCKAGYYLPKNAALCATCTLGNYCVGGTFGISTSADQGLASCPGVFLTGTGVKSQNECYVKLTAGTWYDIGAISNNIDDTFYYPGGTFTYKDYGKSGEFGRYTCLNGTRSSQSDNYATCK